MKKNIGDRIVDLRDRNKLKSSELARGLNISFSAMRAIEKSQTEDPGITIFREMIKLFNLDPYQFYELITGETYSEVSNDPIIEENARLKERIAEQKDEIAFLRGLLNNHAAPVININVDKDKEGAEGRSEGGEPQVRGKAVDSTAPL